MLVAGVGLGWIGIKLESLRRLAQSKQQLAASISKLGGVVRIDEPSGDIAEIWIEYPANDLAPLVKALKRRLSGNDPKSLLVALTITHASDLSPLVELTSITRLCLIDNSQVTDLSPLGRMTNLRTLEIEDLYSQISDDQEKDLRRALPKCDIVFRTK